MSTFRYSLRGCLLGASALGAGCLAFVGARAETAAPTAPTADTRVQEIIVTATRRATNIQDTPVAISAVSGKKLENLEVTDLFTAAPYLPGVTINGTAGYGNFPVGIRGVASSTSSVGSDDPVATYIDGVYVGKPSAVMADLLDVDQVEVVRGPQGTLYGRNASAGAILVNHATPTDTPSFSGDVSDGSFGRWVIDGRASGPLGDGFTASLAIRHTDMSGWGENTYNDTKAVSREATSEVAALAYQAGPWKSVLRADAEDETNHDAFKKINAIPFNTADPVSADASLAGAPNTYSFNYPTVFNRRDGGLSLTNEVDLGGGTVLHSITGYRYDTLKGTLDTDATAANLNTNGTDEGLNQFSQTLYATGGRGWGTWIGGLDFYKGLTRVDQLVGDPAIGSSLDIFGHDDDTSLAGFGEGTAKLGDFSLTGGGRLSTENKDFEYRGVGAGLIPNYADTRLSKTWNAFTPSVRLAYDPTQAVMAYVSVASGYKSGGFTVLQPAAFNPERVLTYEAGVKTTWLDGALTLDGDAFWSDYKNLQVRVPISVGVIETLNAAAATIRGAEFEGGWRVTDRLSFTGFADFTDAQYDNYIGPGGIQNSGQYLDRAPKWQDGATARYAQPIGLGKLTGELTYAYRSKIFFQAPNLTALGSPGFNQLDARIAYDTPDGHWTLALVGRNLIDGRHIDNVIVFATNLVASYNEPASYVVKLSFRY
jgi:iron complex outermembrane receptor protein